MLQWFFLVFLAGLWPYVALGAVLFVVLRYWLGPYARRQASQRRLNAERTRHALEFTDAGRRLAADFILELERDPVLYEHTPERIRGRLYELQNLYETEKDT